MKLASVEAILSTLNDEGVLYLIAGGLAVNAHGYVRLTQDVDLVIALDQGNILRAFQVLGKLGYRPIVPITSEQFADADLRARWIREKGMRVLNFFSDQHRETNIDLFVSEPFDVRTESASAMRAEIAPGVVAPFVSLATLIAMKTEANRPRDLDDIQHLQWLARQRDRNE